MPSAIDPVRSALLDRQLRARLQSVTRRIAESGPDAEDAFQDAVVQALTHADRFRSDSLVSTWLHRIFVNSALMGRRRSAVWTRRTVRLGADLRKGLPAHGEDGERSGLLGSSGAGAVFELRDAGPTPEDVLAEREQREHLRAAIARLPSRSRKTVEAFLGDEARGDAGEARGTPLPTSVSSNAIRARLSRARTRLKELVGVMEMSAMPGTI